MDYYLSNEELKRINTKKMTDGVKMINLERQKQIEKHDYNKEHDRIYKNGQLSEAAIYAINGDYESYPKDWDLKFKDKIGGLGKNYLQRLVIAGALIAAEIDRVLDTKLN